MNSQKLFFSTLFFFVFLFSCKTTEQIEREKRQKAVFSQVEYLKKQSTVHKARIQEQEDRLNHIFGQLEETQHEEKKRILNREKERLRSLEELTIRMDALDKRLKKQEVFIGQVTKQLTSIATASSSKKNSRTSSSSKYQQALRLFQNKKYKRSKELFLQTLGNDKLKSSQWVYANYHLALIYYREKNYRQAMVHASKVYTQYPRSSKAPRSLLTIAQCFLALKQKEEARGTLRQLMKQYPKAKEIKQAQKLLKRL